jgi:hypothetical protein
MKSGVGGTPLISTVTYNDWNVSHNELYDKYRIQILNGLSELKHVLRKDPKIKGFVWMQGETDAIETGAGTQYKTNFYGMFNALLDAMTTAGWTVDEVRLLVFRITDAGGFSYDVTEYPLVRTAQEEIGDNYLTDNPSYSTKVDGSTWRDTDTRTFLDAQHYDGAALDEMGKECFYYLFPFANLIFVLPGLMWVSKRKKDDDDYFDDYFDKIAA